MVSGFPAYQTTPDRLNRGELHNLSIRRGRLTASDRPYMQPKKLSQAIGIMRSMSESGHLCPEVFELFLESGVPSRYASEYLPPHQIDDSDQGVRHVRETVGSASRRG